VICSESSRELIIQAEYNGIGFKYLLNIMENITFQDQILIFFQNQILFPFIFNKMEMQILFYDLGHVMCHARGVSSCILQGPCPLHDPSIANKTGV
jgi:hypothetical protein